MRCLETPGVVIGGSHGKTSITSLILHVLRHHGRKFDYAVGAQLEGFDLMVQLTEFFPRIHLRSFPRHSG